ncbi:hypothetical protein DPMN_002818 [Dreissena polymorpha]|uniref:Secreted protein n=1 Tax=Dreissena polymorpha TaxID=45954 RepID=A0A9D4MJU5_DREPO|nr:hypothetical protein DPMN_002818 [Dreissena polymorpha]
MVQVQKYYLLLLMLRLPLMGYRQRWCKSRCQSRHPKPGHVSKQLLLNGVNRRLLLRRQVRIIREEHIEVSHRYRKSLNACSICSIRSFPLEQVVWNKYFMHSIELLLCDIKAETEVKKSPRLCDFEVLM